MGEDFTAKDFRTWAGTRRGRPRPARCQPPSDTAGDAKRKVITCVKAVAGLLGNTPAVCRRRLHPPR